LGGIEQAKEECRDERKVNLIENFLQDVRFGLRLLRRSPGFSLLAILCLTLGIGANAAVFSWIEGILFRPYPAVAHQERLDAIGVPLMLGRGFLPGEDQGQSAHPIAVISYQLWQGRFRGDPQIVGKTQRLNGVMHTIVGVAREGFYGTFVGWGMNFWVPASMEDIFESDRK